jgi:hypothetical protein
MRVCRGIKTHILCSIFFPSENRVFHEIMWKKCRGAEEATDCNMTRRFLFACWIIKVTDTRSGYVILFALPRQKLLRERDLILRYKYMLSCLMLNCMVLATTRPAKVKCK